MLWNLVKSGLLGFFLAGAVVFQLAKPFYMGRVVFSLSLFGVLYGVESVLRFGHITTSGLLSGHDSHHSVRAYGLLLWAGLFAYFTWRSRRQEPGE